MKNSLVVSIADLSRLKKQSANLQISQIKLFILRRKQNEEKLTDPKRPVGHHQNTNISSVGVPNKEEKTVRKFQEMMVENFLDLTKYKNLHIQEAQGTPKKKLKEIHTQTHNQTVESQREP